MLRCGAGSESIAFIPTRCVSQPDLTRKIEIRRNQFRRWPGMETNRWARANFGMRMSSRVAIGSFANTDERLLSDADQPEAHSDDADSPDRGSAVAAAAANSSGAHQFAVTGAVDLHRGYLVQPREGPRLRFLKIMIPRPRSAIQEGR